MTRAILAPLLLLAACEWVALPEACEDLPVPPAVGACFGRPGLDYPGFGPVTLTVAGSVTSVDTGPYPEACDIRFGGAPDDDAVILVVTDAEGVETAVGLVVPDLEDPVEEGDSVSLDLGYTFGEFGPDLGWASLADEAGVEQVVVGLAGTVDAVRAPADVRLDYGDVRCTQADPCGTWSAFDLDVAAADAAGSVPYGEQEGVGAWRVTHGGFERQATGARSNCPDWFVGHVSAAFARESVSD